MNCCVQIPCSRNLRHSFKEDIVRDLLTSTTAQAELEAEWQQLKEDREALRSIFPTGNSKVLANRSPSSSFSPSPSFPLLALSLSTSIYM